MESSVVVSTLQMWKYLLCVVHVNSSNEEDDQDDWQNYCQSNVLTQDLMGWLE